MAEETKPQTQNTIVQLRRNVAGRQAGETFTLPQATASGIDPAEFAPLKGEVTDRAIKAPSRK
jgi:hypothetical protein